MTQEIKIHVLHTGKVIVDKALPFHHDNDRPLAWTGFMRPKSDLISVPVSTYLIEHPKGLILIDTGWNSVNRTKWGQIKNLSFQYPVNKADLTDGQTIDEKLAALGYHDTDIDYLLMSHMHCDHADGLRLVKNAKRIMLSQEELHACKTDHFHYLPHEWRGVKLTPYEYSDLPFGPHHRAYDVFGDGSVIQVWVPGHSAGLSATIVKSYNTNQYVLLAADTGYAAKSWEEMLTPGVVIDRAQAKQSLEWIKQQSEENNNIATLANHDPEVKEQIITL